MLLFLYVSLMIRKDIDYFCVVHETGRGLFSHAKGRPKGSQIEPLPCSPTMLDKIIDLRKDIGLNNETKMLVMLSLSTNDMNRYVAMYPEVWFVDCTAGERCHCFWNPLLCFMYEFMYNNLYFRFYVLIGTNRQKKQLFVMAVRTPSGSTLPGNLTIVPSEQKWVFYSIYQLAFPHLYSVDVCSRNRLVLTDEDDALYKSFESLIQTNDVFKRSKVMLCTFHAIWMSFKKDIQPLVDHCKYGKLYGK